MFEMPPSITHNLSLETVINRLKQHELVIGIVVAGSAGRDDIKPESDYDIVIILKEYPLPMHVILTTIEGRMTDIAFWEASQLDDMLTMPVVRGNIAEAAVFNWIKTGTIHYDETGKLAQVREYEPNFLIGNDQRAKFNLWYRINFNLYHGQRMLTSDDDVYLTAMDFRFLYMLGEVFDAYMMNYSIPQRGEKHTVRYMQDHAPDHLALYLSALRAIDRQQKFAFYKAFAEIALEPIGGLWDSEQVVAFNLADKLPLERYSELITFWETLIQP